jgi:glycosyltransferase involved in cell wall biosynthesis
MTREGEKTLMRVAAQAQATEGVEAVIAKPRASLSVCICTHERPDYLRSCLDSLRAQTIGTDAFDIVVVDSASSPAATAKLEEVVAGMPNARLVRIDQPGASVARNYGVGFCTGSHVAFLDDDAVAAPDWLERIQDILDAPGTPPAVIGGRVLPRWEAPLPAWWPESLRGVLSIIEWEGQGEYRSPELPRTLEPYSVNMVVHRESMLAVGGFDVKLGRVGTRLLSDEDVHLAWKLQDAGYSARYDSRVVVYHQIQAPRLRPEWLLDRLYWQGASTVLTRRLLGNPGRMGLELARRLLVEILFAPAALLPGKSTRLLGLRWRYAYSCGFTRMALANMARKREAVLPGLRRLLSHGLHALRSHEPTLGKTGTEVPPSSNTKASA